MAIPPSLSDTCSHLCLDLALCVVDGHHLDGSRAVGSGAGSAQELLVAVLLALCLVAPPAGGVVGNAAALTALHHRVALVVWRRGKGVQWVQIVALCMYLGGPARCCRTSCGPGKQSSGRWRQALILAHTAAAAAGASPAGSQRRQEGRAQAASSSTSCELP